MLTMAMIGKIRRMYFRDHLSFSEIARRTGLSRNTVKKWLRAPEGSEPVYKRQSKPGKLTPYIPQIEQALRIDAHRPRKERRTAQALFHQLQAEGYQGGYTRLTDFIRQYRQQQGKALSSAFVPLHFQWGEAFQFDWGEERVFVGGIWRKLQVAHIKLCASRAFWLIAYPSQSHEMLFDAHTRAFTALGGISRRGIYDNMKTAVDRVPRGKNRPRQVNARFAAMCSHYLFDAEFCNVAAGWEKGIVEKNIQDSRRRLWQQVNAERFSNLDELNRWLAIRCKALWQEISHPEHKPLSIAQHTNMSSRP